MANFIKDLEYSLGQRQTTDIEKIKDAIPTCIKVEKTDEAIDRKGIDYIATLKKGSQLYIDGKARRKLPDRDFINGYPVCAIETWSVIIGNEYKKVGWTYNPNSEVDIILYTFDINDWDKFYMIPFPFLKIAAIHNYHGWAETYGLREQISGAWRSEAMFVPANILIESVTNEMIHEINKS